MRCGPVCLALLLVVIGCKSDEVAELRGHLERQAGELQVVRLAAAQQAAELKTTRQSLNECVTVRNRALALEADVGRRAFYVFVTSDPTRVSRWINWPVDKILTEQGQVRDLPSLARAFKARTCKTYPGTSCLRVLVQPNNLGSAAGTAVYYDRIKE